MKRKTIINLLSRQLLWAFIIISFNLSCKKDDNLINENTLSLKDEKLYQAIINGGVKSEDIKDLNDYYLVEGDILFKKNATDISKVNAYFKDGRLQSEIIELVQSKAIGGNGKISSANIPGSISQWQTHNLISSVNVENIKVNTLASPWSDATLNAVDNWKNIPNCKINFYNVWEVNSSDANSITFVAAGGDPAVAGAYAVAEFPSSGQAGYRIRINTAYNNSLSTNQKIFILSHEIGHCIGLRHTNWQGAEYQEPNGAILIPGTPSTDVGSVMNRGGVPTVPNWGGFSYYDIIAAQTLYPYGPYDQWLNDIPYFSGYNEDVPPPVTWNPGLVSTPTVSLEVFQYGISKGVVAANIPNNGSYTINYRSYLTTQGHNWTNVQVKIISDSNPGVSDISPLFYFYWD
jgi:predicted Zn-dependent protease